ncbi:MAG: NAD(P)H-hydrate dehydratase [Gammaproteobacteria bacterium]
MNALPSLLYDARGTRALDRYAIDTLDIPGFTLMQRAGRAAFDELARRWPRARRLSVVCGGGNNGGDGFIIGALAREAGYDVRLLAIADPARLTGDAARALALAVAAGLVVEPWSGRMAAADVIVDALFGTGIDRPVQGVGLEVIDAINAAACPVLAVDVPSGLDASSGYNHGAAVVATATISFIALKQGLLTGDGPACAGDIVYAPLDLSAACFDAVAPTARRLDYAQSANRFTPRRRTAHKGDFGHVLVVGGAPGFGGGARLAAAAAARVGAGLVSLATHPDHAANIGLARPEIMCHGIAAATDLRRLAARASVLAIGPGLGQDAWGRTLLAAVREFRGPQVWDADALNLLAADPDDRGERILTPHPGEAARLLASATATIAQDRFAAAAAIARRYRSVTLLKGAGTIVQAPSTLPTVIGGGNPGMASGGMGDVLCGVIAGLLAQGWALADAAALGACVHAEAADRAARHGGERGMLAGDLMPFLRTSVNPPA